MDGKSFFYTNAMEIKTNNPYKHAEAERSGWFPCSCCPTNVTRLIPSIPGYLYAQRGTDIYVNLFATSTTQLSIGKKNVQIVQANNYPWDGNLKFTVSPASTLDFNLLIRIPGWAQNEAIPSDLYAFSNSHDAKVEIKINGKAVDYQIEKGYAVLKKTWKKNDVVEIDLPMTIHTIKASEKVADDIGKVALQRGPLVYCAEWPDNQGATSNIILDAQSQQQLKSSFKTDVLHGVAVLEGNATVVKVDAASNQVTTSKQPFTAIPYYAWAHRGKGEMTVWFPERIKAVDIISK
jgi:hypothetical protein